MKTWLFNILEVFQKLFLAIIFDVRIFRVIEILEKLPYQLRNKFHFSDIHRSMNTKWFGSNVNFALDAMFILQWITEKLNLSLIFTLYFDIIFIHCLWNFNVNLVK